MISTRHILPELLSRVNDSLPEYQMFRFREKPAGCKQSGAGEAGDSRLAGGICRGAGQLFLNVAGGMLMDDWPAGKKAAREAAIMAVFLMPGCLLSWPDPIVGRSAEHADCAHSIHRVWNAMMYGCCHTKRSKDASVVV